MSSFLVIGAGGHAKMVIAAARAAGIDQILVFDDDPTRWGTRLLDAEIVGPIGQIDKDAGAPAIIAIGDGAVRRRIAQRLSLSWACVVHPFTFVDPSVVLGPGTVVAAGAVVQPGAVVGSHCVINTGASVDHDCRVGNFVTTGPGARLAGGVIVGEGVLLGVGCCVRPMRQIGDETVVGAGAVVVSDLPAHALAYGVPARVTARRDADSEAA